MLVTRTVGTGDREGQMKAVFLDEVGHEGKVDAGELGLPRFLDEVWSTKP